MKIKHISQENALQQSFLFEMAFKFFYQTFQKKMYFNIIFIYISFFILALKFF